MNEKEDELKAQNEMAYYCEMLRGTLHHMKEILCIAQQSDAPNLVHTMARTEWDTATNVHTHLQNQMAKVGRNAHNGALFTMCEMVCEKYAHKKYKYEQFTKAKKNNPY
ncbi:MAG: hypothetical protein LBU60_04185 [Clostridiales bacterium]|jgi:hypothetical protein|nr:hypothetical protein [Clostridiales bacterium]